MSANYFKNLNYTLGDEDAAIEMALLPQRCQAVAMVAGSGGRVIPMLSREPQHFTCVDIAPEQLFLTELRVATLRALSHEEFLAYWGYPPVDMDAKTRQTVFSSLPLPGPTRQYLETFFRKIKYGPPVYQGRFEKMMGTLSRVNRIFTGKRGRALFETRTLSEQVDYYGGSFPHRALKFVLFLMGNATVLNALLYRGAFPKKNLPDSTYRVYARLFESLFTTQLARESFFLQLVFFGRIQYPEGNPLECDPDVYHRAQAALAHSDVQYVHGDILEFMADHREDIDFLVLSDVPSFLAEPQDTAFLQIIRPGMRLGGTILTRGHLRIAHPETQGYEIVSQDHSEIIKRERTQLWQIDLYRKIGDGGD